MDQEYQRIADLLEQEYPGTDLRDVTKEDILLMITDLPDHTGYSIQKIKEHLDDILKAWADLRE